MFPSRIGKLRSLVLAFCLASFPTTRALRTASACEGRSRSHVSFCVNATIENDIATYQLTNLVEAEDDIGWMAIGFGTTMLNSQLVVLWKNGDGSMTVSQRKAVWYMEPAVVKQPARVAESIEPRRTVWHPEKSTTYAFQIPTNKTQLARFSKEELVFAYSPVRPDGDSPHARMARHKEAGYLTLEFSEQVDPAPSSMPPPPTSKFPPSTGNQHSEVNEKQGAGSHEKSSSQITLILLHAFFLSFAFLFLLPAGVLTARWARTFTPVWFKVHWILNWPVAMPLILLGWLLGPVAVNQHAGGHFNDPHKIWGTIIVSVYLVQVLLGRHIHKKRVEQTEPIHKAHPPSNIAHAAAGCLLLVFAFLQVRSGLEKLSYVSGYYDSANSFIKFWNFWVVAVPFTYVIGLYFIPKQFAQEQEMIKAQAEGYAPVLSDEGARLLAEERDVEQRLQSKPR